MRETFETFLKHNDIESSFRYSIWLNRITFSLDKNLLYDY